MDSEKELTLVDLIKILYYRRKAMFLVFIISQSLAIGYIWTKPKIVEYKSDVLLPYLQDPEVGSGSSLSPLEKKQESLKLLIKKIEVNFLPTIYETLKKENQKIFGISIDPEVKKQDFKLNYISFISRGTSGDEEQIAKIHGLLLDYILIDQNGLYNAKIDEWNTSLLEAYKMDGGGAKNSSQGEIPVLNWIIRVKWSLNTAKPAKLIKLVEPTEQESKSSLLLMLSLVLGLVLSITIAFLLEFILVVQKSIKEDSENRRFKN